MKSIFSSISNWGKTFWGRAREVGIVMANRAEGGLGKELFFALLLVGVGFLSFALGRLSKVENPPPVIIDSGGETFRAEFGKNSLMPPIGAVGAGATLTETGMPEGTIIIGTKTTRNYYFLWCAGYNRIKESNRVYFSSKEEAERSGYHKAPSCAE